MASGVRDSKSVVVGTTARHIFRGNEWTEKSEAIVPLMRAMKAEALEAGTTPGKAARRPLSALHSELMTHHQIERALAFRRGDRTGMDIHREAYLAHFVARGVHKTAGDAFWHFDDKASSATYGAIPLTREAEAYTARYLFKYPGAVRSLKGQ